MAVHEARLAAEKVGKTSQVGCVCVLGGGGNTYQKVSESYEEKKLLVASSTQLWACGGWQTEKNVALILLGNVTSLELQQEQHTAWHGNTEDVQPFTVACIREEAGIARKVFHTG